LHSKFRKKNCKRSVCAEKFPELAIIMNRQQKWGGVQHLSSPLHMIAQDTERNFYK
jgi:hypothetical protein